MAITVPPVRGAGDLGHVDDSNIVRQALLDLDAADAAHDLARGDVHGFRWDETVGRRLFAWDSVNQREQMVYGDTGWRDVSASLTNSWGGSLFIRRTLNDIILSGRITVPAGGFTANYYVAPTGFRGASGPMSGYNMGVAFNASSSRASLPMYGLGTENSTLALGSTAAAGNLIDIGGRYVTSDPWPTSLPGTASGDIPTGLAVDTAELLPAEEN